MSETTSLKLINQIISDLDSDQETKILQALAKIPERGTDKVIPVLIKLLEKDYSDAITGKTTAILSELKNSSSLPALIEGLSTESSKVREVILSSIWHSGLDASNYLPRIVKAGIAGSYMECVEALTIVENIDILPSDANIMESLMLLREEEEKSTKNENSVLLSEMKKIIQAMEDSL
ncbi:MAG: HEAT repeat domain-containing protein [Flavobacteriales bacterium]